MKDDVERGWQEPIYDIYLSNVLGIIPTFHFLKYIYTKYIYTKGYHVWRFTDSL